MYRWECRPDRRRPTRTTVLGAPRPGAARGPRCRAMRYHHAADSYVYTNHAPWHVTRRGTLGPGSRASTSTPPPWWGNENHGLTLRVCPCSAHERTPATTFTQRTPSPDESIRSKQLRASRHDCGSFWGCDRAAFASAGPACRAAVTHPARRLAVRAGPRRCFPVVGEGSSGGLDREWAGCRQRRDQDGSAPKALRLVIAALAGLLGGREERVQIAARPVQPKTVTLQGETNGQTARSPTFMPEDPQLIPPQERIVNAHTSFSSRTAFKRASQPVVPSSELHLNWSTRPQGPNRTMPGRPHVIDRYRPRRRPHCRDQPDLVRRHHERPPVWSIAADSRRTLRRTRPHRRQCHRSHHLGGGTAAPARQHTELGPWFDARQARCQGVPGHSGGARKARRPRLHLYRRQRYSRHAGASAPAIDRIQQLRACAQDHRQRPDGKRPRTRLHLGSGFRVGCVRQHGSRFPRHAGHLCRYRHGPPCRLPHRCGGGLAAIAGRCAASDLYAGKGILGGAVPQRCRYGLYATRTLHHLDVGRRAG